MSVRRRDVVHDWTSIFRGSASAARDLASELECQGVRSFVSDRHGPDISRGGDHATYSRVLVPPEEEERAREAVARWESSNRRDSNLLVNRLARVLGISLVAPIAWGTAYLLAPKIIPEPSLPALFAIWLASLIAVAQIEHRRYRRERIRLPAV